MKGLLKHSRLVIIASIALTVVLAIPILSVSIENTVRCYLPMSNPSFKRLIATEEQFGSMVSIGISLETGGETILTPEYISVIQAVTEKIENLEGVNSVESLTNIDFVYSLDGALASGKLVDESYAGTSDDIKKIKSKIVDWQEMYNRVIIDDNFKAVQFVVTIDPSLMSSKLIEIYHKIRDLTEAEVQGYDLSARYYGDAVLGDNATQYMLTDLFLLIPLVVLIVVFSLYFSFHTMQGTLLPLIAVLMATVWACGVMSLCGVTVTIVASVIPVALIACGSAYGIHVMTHYYAFLEKVQGELTKEKHAEIICESLKDVWPAVLLAGVTTVAGFVSLVTSPMNPLKSFAVFTALGIVFSLLLSVTFIPAMLYITPLKRVEKKQTKKRIVEKDSGKTLYNIYHFFAGTKVRLAVFSVAIILFSAWGLSKLVINTSFVNYFPADSKFRKDIDYVDKTFAGTNSLYFVISGQEKGDLTKPEILRAVDNLQNYLVEKYDGIGKAVSFTTFIKRMNQVMHAPVLEAEINSGEEFFDAGEGYAEDDWGTDDWGDEWADSDDWNDGETASVAETKDWIDPNIEYAKKLNSQISVQEALQMFADAYTAAGGRNATIEKMVFELEKALNFNGIAYYETPYDLEKYPAASREDLANLVSQYLLLYGGSLERFSDDQLAPQKIIMQLQLRIHDTTDTRAIIEDAKLYAAKHFPKNYTIEVTGNCEMELTMSEMVVKSQFTSIAFSLILVFIILTVSFKSPLAGVIGAIPVGFAIVLNFMMMGFLGINLDLVTSIIASVAVGVGIDYTIHFLENYRALRSKNENVEEVTMKTFAIAGRGIITNAIAVGLGFAVLILSRFEILRYIGKLAVIVMFTSSFLAMTIIPGVLNAEDPKFIQKKLI